MKVYHYFIIACLYPFGNHANVICAFYYSSFSLFFILIPVQTAAELFQLLLQPVKSTQIGLRHCILRCLQLLGKLLADLAVTALGLLTPIVLLTDHLAQLRDGSGTELLRAAMGADLDFRDMVFQRLIVLRLHAKQRVLALQLLQTLGHLPGLLREAGKA